MHFIYEIFIVSLETNKQHQKKTSIILSIDCKHQRSKILGSIFFFIFASSYQKCSQKFYVNSFKFCE